MKNSFNYLIPDGLFCLYVIGVEWIFYGLSGYPFEGVTLLRISLFSLATSLAITSVVNTLPKLIKSVIQLTVVWFLALYGLSQLSYFSYMNAHYSFSLLLSMFNRVEDYAGDFSQYIRLKNLFILLPALAFSVSVYTFFKPKSSLRYKVLVPLMFLCVHLVSMQILKIPSSQERTLSLQELYENPYLVDLGLQELGLSRFLIRDLTKLVLDIPDPLPEIVLEEPEVITPEPEVLSQYRVDDALWKTLMTAETDETTKTLDQILMNRTQLESNEYTGLFKGKNLILIMVEAFDYMALDPELTPTLVRLSQEGFFFDHYYAPQYSCATGESEFIALTSLVPRAGICSPNTYTQNAYPTSLFNLFNREGYSSTSYHSYSDKFYERTLLHASLGSQQFYNNDDLAIKTLKGWPSDVNLMDEAFPHFSPSEPYFSFIITASTHFPYDVDSTLGNRYLEEISAIHPDMDLVAQRYLSKAMELDKAIERLIELLTQSNQLDDTVLVLFGDHFPLKTDRSILTTYGNPASNRESGYNINLLPMIIYNSATPGQRISTSTSSFDLTPTLANLFGLKIDSRFYMGTDVLDKTQRPVITYPSLSWNTSEGTYSYSSGKFKPYDEKNSLSAEEIEAINRQVKENSDVSYAILKSDYFAKRDELFRSLFNRNQCHCTDTLNP